MTQDEIIAFARESGLPLAWISETGVLKWSELERFARIVAQHEREQCAQLVEPSPDHLQNPWHYLGGDEGVELLIELAETIRSRGER